MKMAPRLLMQVRRHHSGCHLGGAVGRATVRRCAQTRSGGFRSRQTRFGAFRCRIGAGFTVR